MTEPSEILQKELKEKQICRFCLTQDNLKLTSIHSRQNRFNNSAPLPLQVMACVSIEVFFNDGMPSYVCSECRLVFEHAYRFKQMCKKADTILRQYPLTGKWPRPLEKPKIPEELFPKVSVMKVLNKPPITTVKEESPPPASEFIIQTNLSSSQFKVVSSSPNQFTQQKSLPVKPRVLNKNSMKILNKDAGNTIFEPVLSRPIIKRDIDGNVEVVSEILEADNVRQVEPDPVETAIPIETNVFPCPHCERSFPLKQLLDIHMVNHKRERSYECSHCDKRFFSKYDLSKHVLIHTGEKPYKCVVCSKAFTRSTLLSRHEKVHTDIPKYLCVYCEKEFLSKEELEKHTSRHTKNRPFSCRICNKAFAFKQGLERHEVVHSKNQPFPCQYCDLSFSTSSKLSRHLTAHAGERPYPCKLCPKSYLLSHHLTRHLRSHKEGSGSYNCCECKQVFSSRDDLIYHSAVHATQNLVCPLCKEAFNDLDTVTKHIEDHADGEQYACEFCDLIYMTADRLQAHSNLEHSEDMAAYDDQPNYIPKSEYDDPESEQIIEEFIIEQYDDENLDVQEEEEEAWESEIEAKGRPQKKRPHSLLNSTKIEEMDPMDESSLLSELIDDPAPPPAKVVKTEKGEFSQLRVVSKSTAKSVLQNDKTQMKNENNSKEFKENSTSTLKSMIKTLPKTVTITKKSDVRPEEKKVLPTREIRQRVQRSDGNAKPVEDKTEKSSSMTEARPLVKSLRSSAEKKPEPRVLNNEKVKKLNVTKPSIIVSGSTSSKSPAGAASTSTSPIPSTSTSNSTPIGNKQLVEMTIGNRRVKVQKITVSKAQVAAMSKEGRIEMKDGTMILKQSDISGKKRIVKKIPT